MSASTGAHSATAPTATGLSLSRAAVSQTEIIDVPVSGTIVNDCNGESVELTGTIRQVIHVTVTGNTYHSVEHANATGITGMGLTTGARYVVSNSNVETFNSAMGSSFTFTNSFLAIGQGKAPNFVITEVLRVARDANGNVTRTTIRISTSCH